MKRRLTAILLLISLMIGLLSLTGCGKESDEGSDEYVNRGQWIAMLGETFGMDNYESSTPRYSDIQQGNDLFPYVQAAAEWDVLSVFTGDKLEAEKEVSCEEVASTAAIAVGCTVDSSHFSGNGSFDTQDSVSYAIENGIINAGADLQKKMTHEECETALNAARTAYLTMPQSQQGSNVIPMEDVADLTDIDWADISAEGNRISLPGTSLGGGASNNGSNLPDAPNDSNENANKTATVETANGPVEVSVGEVFVTAPTPEYPTGIAYKVTEIEEVNGEVVFQTEAPTLYDLFEELSVHETVSIGQGSIIWAPGVTASPASGVAEQGETYTISLLSYDAAPLSKSFGNYSKHFEFGSGSFEKKWSNKNSSVLGGGTGAQALENSNFVYDKTPSIEDFGGSTDPWTENLQVENKFSGGYKITGDISINSLTVTTDVEYKRTKWLDIPYGIESASIKINSDISSTLTFQGNLSNELTIATVPIPIGPTGLSVSIDLLLYVNASGSLQVRAALGSQAKVEYANSKVKGSADSDASATMDVAIAVDFGAKLRASLDALGIVKIMDASVKAGGTLEASAYVGGTCEVHGENNTTTMHYKESMKINADLYVPIVDISAGGSNTLLGSLGLSKTWNIKTKGNAKKFELVNEEWVFWEETITTDGDGNITDEDATSADEQDGVGSTDQDRIDFTSYVLTLTGENKQIELILPEGQAAASVVWTSENPAIARVDNSGVVSPVSTGVTKVTASLADNPGVSVSCMVYVEAIGEQNWVFLPSDTAYRT